MGYSIFLRGFEMEDAPLINRWRNNPEIQKLVSTSFKYVSLDIEKEWVKSKMMDNRKDIYLAICLNDDSRKMVGYVSVNNINYLNRTAVGGGIVIDPLYQDGIIRYEVGMLIRELVFNHLNINRYEGKCLSEHIASRIIMEASGYKLEGICREVIYKDGKYHDQCVYSLLRADYEEWMERGDYSLSVFVKKVRHLRNIYAASRL